MAPVGFSEAARLAGVSRQHLYRLAEAGQLSVSKDLLPGKTGEDPAHYRQCVDTAELQRVFGPLGDAGEAPPGDALASSLQGELANLRALLQDRDAQLQEAREREAWLRQQINEVQSMTKLLGHTQPADVVPREKHERICRNGQRQINTLVADLEALRGRGLLARLFNK